MFLSKKIAKLQRFREVDSQKPKFSSHQEDFPSAQKTFASRTPLEPKKKPQKLRFQQIPPHSKYVPTQPVFGLHGVSFAFCLHYLTFFLFRIGLLSLKIISFSQNSRFLMNTRLSKTSLLKNNMIKNWS